MNRRRFLKYAGATAAVVGASALGLDYLLSPRQGSPSLTSLSESVQSSSSQLYSLEGRLFFDYNGNGKQDGDEPSVQNADITITGWDLSDTPYVAGTTTTDSSGDYSIDLPAANYKFLIKPDTTNPKNPIFRYMCQSDSYVTDIGEGYPLSVIGPGNFNVGLMEGFLTLPFPKSIPLYVNPEEGDYFFHGPAEPNAIWWNGQTEPGPRFHTPAYANPATDFYMPEGTEVKAALPGRVSTIYMKSGDPSFITLDHFDGWETTYVHPSRFTVPVGAFVERGDTIALSSNIGTGSSDDYHTAFQLWKTMSDGRNYYIDPFSPVNGVPKGAWIAPPPNRPNGVYIGGTWTWHPQGENEEWISQGYWTKLNDPQYPDSE